MGPRGHLKLIDFGFAKTIKKGAKSYTMCGTPNYMAPEGILGSGHDQTIDVWAFACVVHEMLMARTPFSHPTDPNDMT